MPATRIWVRVPHLAVVTAGLLAALLPIPLQAAGLAVHSSGRYFQDAAAKPLFLIGYYNWASVAPDCYIDHPSRYAAMMQQGSPYGMNYLRISLGINRMTAETNPPSWDGRPTPIVFNYVNGKADLDQWDSAFWAGLRSQIELAAQHGIQVHVAIFDGVDIRGGSQSYRWANSYWNIDNQVRDFFGDLDVNNDGNADRNGEFYRTAEFTGDVGVGRYQRRVIEKAIVETAGYDNVFFEIGNELLSSPADWNAAVISYVSSKSSKVITQNGGSLAANLDGWAQHEADTPLQLKQHLTSIVGQGHPAWEDPDGPDLISAGPHDLRRSAWYSLAGGAAGWGGFTTDFWAGGSGFNAQKAGYYRNLVRFISESGLRFWDMVPRHDLIENGAENSLLTRVGAEYLAYVLNDPAVTINLSELEGPARVRLYDPRAGAWMSDLTSTGGSWKSFTRADGMDDWVIHITSASPSPDLDGDGDVDQEDFGVFQTCFSGSGHIYPAGCARADLGSDGDVDGDDLSVFVNCMNGPNQPPGC